MCGICGFNWRDKELLHEMLESIKHRGPDDRGIYETKNMSLGHNRLSIIDLSKKGRNPIWNEDKTKCIIFNGEIYNYKKLRKDLEKKGHNFRSKTDTEVILHGYEEYSKNILTKLNGMFAFAIYDKKGRSLFIARDRLGIKPVYYYYNKEYGEFIFSSEIKAILKHKKIKRTPNYYAITEYLTFQNLLDDKSFFKEIKILLPGNYLFFKNNNLEIQEYWKPTFSYKKRTYLEILNESRKILEKSVERHLISDVPVGAYLSGGFDSGTISTLASKLMNQQLKTFTCKFNVKGEYDETPIAKKVAEKIGAKNYDVEITQKEFIDNINNMIYHLDEPKVGIPVISMYHLSELVSKHVKVVLTGHSGDELFAGYPVFQAKQYKQELRNPLKIPKILFRILKDKKRLNILYYLLLPIIYPEINPGLVVVFPEKEKKKLLTSDFLRKTKDFSPTRHINKILKNTKNLNEIERLQYLYLKTYLPSLFIAEDKMSMAHSIEARIPLCDNELIDFALSIPINQKLKNNKLKSVIKDSMRNRVPNILYTQEKKGFPTPLGPWLNKGLNRYFEEILLSKRTLSRNIYSKTYLEKLLKKRDFWNINRLWCLLNIELWFRKFIDKNEN